MLEKVRDVVIEQPGDGEERKASRAFGQKIGPRRVWQRLLRGLWSSGLRLERGHALYWDRDDKLMVDLTVIPHVADPGRIGKGQRRSLVAIAPEFGEFLLATPEAYRRGPASNRSHNASKARG